MNRSGVEPLFGHFLRGAAKLTKQRLGCHLYVASLPQPFVKTLGLRANQGVALRMRNNRMQASQLEFVQGLIKRRRNRVIRELDKKIALLVQRKSGGIVPDVLQILEAEMEVTPGRKDQPSFEQGLKFVPSPPYQLRDERVVRARVWRPNDVRDAVLDGHFRHPAGDFHGRRAIIEARKYMAMDVNH